MIQTQRMSASNFCCKMACVVLMSLIYLALIIFVIVCSKWQVPITPILIGIGLIPFFFLISIFGQCECFYLALFIIYIIVYILTSLCLIVFILILCLASNVLEEVYDRMKRENKLDFGILAIESAKDIKNLFIIIASSIMAYGLIYLIALGCSKKYLKILEQQAYPNPTTQTMPILPN